MSNTAPTLTLSACPFCGHRPLNVRENSKLWHISCTHCECEMSHGIKSRVVEMWNTRAQQSAPPQAQAGEREAAERIDSLLADLIGEHEVMAGPIDLSKWKLEVPANDLRVLSLAALNRTPAPQGQDDTVEREQLDAEAACAIIRHQQMQDRRAPTVSPPLIAPQEHVPPEHADYSYAVAYRSGVQAGYRVGYEQASRPEGEDPEALNCLLDAHEHPRPRSPQEQALEGDDTARRLIESATRLEASAADHDDWGSALTDDQRADFTRSATDYRTGADALTTIAQLRAELDRLKEQLKFTEDTCLPVSTDGKTVFIDGPGSVELDHGGKLRERAGKAEAELEEVKRALSERRNAYKTDELLKHSADLRSWLARMRPQDAQLVADMETRILTAEARARMAEDELTDIDNWCDDQNAPDLGDTQSNPTPVTLLGRIDCAFVLAESKLSAGQATAEVVEFLNNWFSPWGSWKTAWWEGAVSDDVPMSEANVLQHVRKLLAPPAEAQPDATGGEG